MASLFQVRFYIRVTTGPQNELIDPKRKEKLDNIQPIIDFLNFVCFRDKFRRPQMNEVVQRFTLLRSQLKPYLSSSSSSPSSSSPSSPKPEDDKEREEKEEKEKKEKEKKEKEKKEEEEREKEEEKEKEISPRSPPSPHALSDDDDEQTGGEKKKLTEEEKSLSERNLRNRINPDLLLADSRYFVERPSEIFPGVFIGSQMSAISRPLLHELQITHVCNTTHAPNSFPEHFTYYNVKWKDENSQTILSDLPRLMHFLRSTVQARGRVLIHSDRGCSRCAAVAIAYTMLREGLDYLGAFIYVKDRRYTVLPNRGFIRQLCAWKPDADVVAPPPPPPPRAGSFGSRIGGSSTIDSRSTALSVSKSGVRTASATSVDQPRPVIIRLPRRRRWRRHSSNSNHNSNSTPLRPLRRLPRRCSRLCSFRPISRSLAPARRDAEAVNHV